MKRSSFPREDYKTNAIRTERYHYDRNQMERQKQCKKEKRKNQNNKAKISVFSFQKDSTTKNIKNISHNLKSFGNGFHLFALVWNYSFVVAMTSNCFHIYSEMNLINVHRLKHMSSSDASLEWYNDERYGFPYKLMTNFINRLHRAFLQHCFFFCDPVNIRFWSCL